MQTSQSEARTSRSSERAQLHEKALARSGAGQTATVSAGEGPGTSTAGTDVLPACSPPDVRTPPTFTIPFRRPIVLKALSVYAAPAIDPVQAPPPLGCATITRAAVAFVLDPLFDQIWTLKQLSIGDLGG